MIRRRFDDDSTYISPSAPAGDGGSTGGGDTGGGQGGSTPGARTTYAQAVQADPVRQWYRFNGDTLDAVGTRHGSTGIPGAPGLIDSDAGNGSAFFSVNEWFDVPRDGLNIDNPCSFEFWASPDMVGMVCHAHDMGGVDGNHWANTHLLFYRDGYTGERHLQWARSDGDTSTVINIVVPWQKLHVVATYDPTAGMTLYVNRQIVAQRPPRSCPLTVSNFRVGRNVDAAGNFISGRLDELAIYTAALSQARVDAHFLAAQSDWGAAVIASLPDGWWKLDDVAGSSSLFDTANTGAAQIGGNPVLGLPGVLPTETSASLDGASSFFVLGNMPTVFPDSLLGDWTFAGWFNLQSTPGHMQYLFVSSNLSFNQPQYVGVYLYVAGDGTLHLSQSSRWLGAQDAAGPAFPFDGWHYVSLTQSAADDQLRVRIDNTEVLVAATNQGIGFGGDGQSALAPVTVAGQADAIGATAAKGYVDELLTYRRALSNAEHTTLYNAGKPV